MVVSAQGKHRKPGGCGVAIISLLTLLAFALAVFL